MHGGLANAGPIRERSFADFGGFGGNYHKNNELSDYGGKCSLCLSLVKIDTVYMSQLMKLSHMAKREMCEDLWMHPY